MSTNDTGMAETARTRGPMQRWCRPRHSTLGAMLAVAVAAATIAGTASADRRATPREHAAVASAAKMPSRCVVVRVSTVDPHWALLYRNSARRCPGADGYVVARRKPARWRVVMQNGGTDESPCSTVRPVPARVGADLKICRR